MPSSRDVGTWQLTEPVDAKTSSFMDAAFDSNALPEDEGSPATASADLEGNDAFGRLQLALSFLKAMGPKSMKQGIPSLIGHVDSVKGGVVTIRLRDDIPTFMMVDGRSYRVGRSEAFLRIPLAIHSCTLFARLSVRPPLRRVISRASCRAPLAFRDIVWRGNWRSF